MVFGVRSVEYDPFKKYVLSVDPGESTGWTLAKYPGNSGEPISLSAMGTTDEGATLSSFRALSSIISHLIIETPAARGSASLHIFVGRIIEVFWQRAQLQALELYMVSPGVWKQYPKGKIREQAGKIAGDPRLTASIHERDSLGMLSWWYLTTGKDVLR